MDRLEQYINDNRSSFDTELPPSGSHERFMARLEAENKERKVKNLLTLKLELKVSKCL